MQALNVYGNAFPNSNEECVNNLSKRLGTVLRNAVKVCKVRSIILGGRAEDSLTEVNIVKPTKYYKNCILRNLEIVANINRTF